MTGWRPIPAVPVLLGQLVEGAADRADRDPVPYVAEIEAGVVVESQ